LNKKRELQMSCAILGETKHMRKIVH